MENIEALSDEQIDEPLRLAEAEQQQLLHAILSRFIPDDQERQGVIEALVFLSVRKCADMISEYSRTMGATFTEVVRELIYGDNQGMFVCSRRYVDGQQNEWTNNASGTVWLDPGGRFELGFVWGRKLLFEYAPSQVPPNTVAVDAETPEPILALLRLGLPSYPRFAPVLLNLEDENASLARKILVQMNLASEPTDQGVPLLRLHYSTFWREETGAA